MSGFPVRLPPPELPPGPRSALVIATTSYSDPSLSQLRAPAADAAEFATVLADPAIGGFDVTSVLDRPAHDVRVAIDEFLTGRSPDDLVVLYVSCHGITDPRRRLYFAATDTRRSHLASTGVDSTWVNDRLDECRARRQILILDCCFSGAFARGSKGTEPLSLDQLTEPGRGRAVLTASDATEYSFEAAGSDDGPVKQDSPVPGSVFTAALLAGLRDGSADDDGDGFVTVDEAYDHAYRQVRASGAAQTPQRWLSSGEGHLLLARNPAGRPIIPAPVPESLRSALENPLPSVRIGAITELGHWLTSGELGKVATASRELEAVADGDIPRVAAEARAALQQAPRIKDTSPPQLPANEVASDAAGNNEAPRLSTEQRSSHPTHQVDVLPHRGRRTFAARICGIAFSPDGRLLASGDTDNMVWLWNPETGEHLWPLAGHTFSVTAVAFSPDGLLLASGSSDSTVRLWNPETGEHLRTLTDRGISARAIAFSPDGSLLASGYMGSTVWLWNPQTGEHLRTLTGHTGWVNAVAFSPDGRVLASGSSDMTVRLWDPETGERLRTLTGHTTGINAVAFAPDGLSMASSDAKSIRLWR